jgi:light-regulated signal transduction histidine kinase (bacteriophytochrome)
MHEMVDILIVDDHVENLVAMEALLEDEHFIIHKALSGNEALGLMLETSFAVVILDVQMPDMNGFETAELMRSHEKTRNIPIIFFTAISTEKQHMFKGYASGAVDYLTKPVEPAILKSKVQIFSELYCQRKIIQNQLRQIEEKNKELEQFAYLASHDLREPLRVITIFLQLLAKHYKDKLDEKANSFIHYAVDGAERMDKLICGLLNYSRVTSGDESFALVDMNEVFREAIANLGAAIHDSGAMVTKDDLPAISGVHTLLVQLLQNLVGNAIKFGKPGIPSEIRVSAVSREREWVFSVRDQGIGIDSKHFERIFAIFQRLHSREEYPGTGIGLALCKRIVERHHGTIWVESIPGEGTTIFFTFPVGNNE